MRIEGGEEGVQALLCSYLAEGRDQEVAAQGSEEQPNSCTRSWLHPSSGHRAGQAWVTRAWPVACRSHRGYSGSVAVAGSYGDRVEVMCPDHIIGVD